jgi:hypothetical protein
MQEISRCSQIPGTRSGRGVAGLTSENHRVISTNGFLLTQLTRCVKFRWLIGANITNRIDFKTTALGVPPRGFVDLFDLCFFAFSLSSYI